MRSSIRQRLTLTFIALAVGPLVLVGVVLTWQSFTTQQQQALNLQREVAQRVSTQVAAFLRGVENELLLTGQVQGLSQLDRDKQRSILSKLLAYHDVFEELTLLDGQGQELVRINRLNIISELGDRAAASELVSPQTSGQTYYSPVWFDEATGEPLMTIAAPLLDAQTGLVDAVLVSDVRVKKIWSLITNLQIGPGQDVYVVDAQDKVVAHRDPWVVLQGTTFHTLDHDGIQPGLASVNPMSAMDTREGPSIQALVARLTSPNVVLARDTVRFGEQEFHIIAEQTVAEALALAISTILVTVVLLVAVLVISGLLGFVIVRQLVWPIQAMARTAQAISAGDLAQQVEVTSQDEVGVLARAFNSMTGQMRNLIHDLEQEVAERQRAGKVLKEQEERLRVALEGTTDGIWDWNLATGQTYFSPRQYTMVGYEPGEFPPAYESWRQLFHPDDAETVEKTLWRAIEKHTPFAIEYRVKAKDGEWRWILGRGKVVEVDEEGKAVRAAGSHTDITERKQAEVQLERNLRETRVRYEISQALAGAETEDEVLDVLIQQAGLYPQAFVSIFTFDRRGSEPTAVVRRQGFFESGLMAVVPVGGSLPASHYPLYHHFSADKPFVSENVLADERVEAAEHEVFRQTGAVSLAVVPLTAGNEWMGFIGVTARHTGYFDEEKLHLYQTLAEQGAVALRAARLRETIRESRQRLSLLVQQSPLAVIEWNLDFEAVTWNPGAEKIFGYTHQKALGRHASFIIPEQARPQVDQVWQALLAQKGGTYNTNENLTKDGRSIICEWFNAPLVGADGQVIGVVSLVQDITERKRIEEALRESEARYRAVIESQVDLISRYLPDTTLTFVNDAYCQFFGKTREELIGQSYTFMVVPEFRDLVRQETENLAKDPKQLVGEYLNYRHDGKECWIQWVVQCIANENGRVVELQAVGRDITERKQAEEALRRSEDKFAKAFRTSPDAIHISRMRDGRYLEINDGFTAMSGYTPAEVIGKTSLEINIWADPQDSAWLRQALKERGEVVGLEARFRPKDGSIRTGLMSARLIEVGGESCVLSITRDITERKQAEEEIRRLNEELEQRVTERTAQLEAANRELEAFSYSVSHDLRSPLRIVDGYTRILEKDYAPLLDAEGERVCAVIHHQTQLMGELIDDLLALSRLGRTEMHMVPINMEALARSVFDELAASEAQERLDFHVDPLPPAVGDPTMIRQVWTNLLSNAVKFSANRERAVIRVSGRQEARETVYSVRDNGAGFEMEYADKLFRVFQRLHSRREFEGTGVGLAIVQQVIHRHGGRVWAEGQVEQGATFYFALRQKGD
jgi:PAS domain S-box-containing protein